MHKKLFIRVSFILFAIFLSLALVEGVLRLFFPKPENLAKLQSSSDFLLENVPNATFPYVRQGEYDNIIHINSWGFRDGEFSLDKDPNVFRIAVLGDSQEEALQVPLEATWQKVLSRRLSEELGRNIETYNFGVSGYGTDQQWLTLSKKVWQFSPDMVILAFSPNDVGDTYKNKLVRIRESDDEFFSTNKNKLIRIKDEGRIEIISQGERAGGNILGKLARETYTYHLIIKAASANKITKSIVNEVRTQILGFAPDERFFMSDAQLVQGPFEVIASQKKTPPEVDYGWQLVKSLIADMAKQAFDHNAKFLITINIPRAQVQEESWETIRTMYKLDIENSSSYQINTVLADFAKSNDLILYDPRQDAIDWYQQTGILHFPQDGHFNENGNKFMGEKVAEFIISSELVK